jgi:putative oxidoreductase
MEKFLGRYSEYVYAIMRIVMGFLFTWHGSQKLLGFVPQMPTAPGAAAQGLSAMTAVAGVIELVGGIMIMIGLFAGIAAFIASGLMAFAYFIAHFSSAAFLPIVNKGELAVVYCFVFLFIAARGSGLWSVDAVFRGTRTLNGS